MADLILTHTMIDNGYCRVYYRNKGREGDNRLFCLQECCNEEAAQAAGVDWFELLVCTEEGEPEYTIRFAENVKEISQPTGDSSIEVSVRRFLVHKGFARLPEPQTHASDNEDRRIRALRTLEYYVTQELKEEFEDGEDEMADLLSDLMHLADARGYDIAHLVSRAGENFEEEKWAESNT